VPIEEAFATKLAPELTQLTGKKVEILNEGMAGALGYPPIVALRIKAALDAKPDMILWILTPWDIENIAATMPVQKTTIEHGQTKRLLKDALVKGSVPDFMRVIPDVLIEKFRDHTRTAFLVRHFLFESQSQYLRSYLMEPDDQAGFLRADLSLQWRHNLKQFDNYDAEIERRASAAGVSLQVVFLPNRAQAAMTSMGEWPANYDPYKLDNELSSIVTSHSGKYIDILPDFRNIPNPEQGYYPLEGHPNARGHAIIARLLAKELTSGAIPALKAATLPQAALEQGR
jgi:hypothetical protein